MLAQTTSMVDFMLGDEPGQTPRSFASRPDPDQLHQVRCGYRGNLAPAQHQLFNTRQLKTWLDFFAMTCRSRASKFEQTATRGGYRAEEACESSRKMRVDTRRFLIIL
jgi:hypothetical protein